MSAYERVKIKTRNHERTHMPNGIGVGVGLRTIYSERYRRKIAVGEIYIYLWAISNKLKFPENSVEI